MLDVNLNLKEHKVYALLLYCLLIVYNLFNDKYNTMGIQNVQNVKNKQK